jgi:hypothetical protein
MKNIVVVCLLLLFGCTVKQDISKCSWKHTEGKGIGGYLQFKTGLFKLKGENIYKNGEMVAIVLKTYGNRLVIKNIHNNEKCEYTLLACE